MTPEQGVFAGATAALVLALVYVFPRPDRRTLSHPAVIGAGLLLLVGLIARVFLVEPTLVHADVAAPLLVDCALQFPLPCLNRGGSYGQYGHWLLGAMTVPMGRDLHGIFAAMQIVGALDIVLLATLAYRLSGSLYAVLLTVAVTGTNPIFMRVAASEDMHNLGLFLGLVGFLAMDVYAMNRRRFALVAAVLALGLMIHTRQTFYLFAPCAFLLGIARGGWSFLTRVEVWAGGLIVLAVLALRVLGSDSASVSEQMAVILSQPVLVPTILRHHPLFDVSRFGLLPLLTIASIVWACVAGKVVRAVAVVFALNFVVTYPCGMASPGVELAQRLSTYAVAALLCAMAGAAFLERWVSPTRRAATGLAIAFAVSAVPPLFPGWQTLRRLTPIHREYLAVQEAARSLPAEFTQLTLVPTDTNSYGGSRYEGLLQRMGKQVDTVLVNEAANHPRPWMFLENIECWTYSFYEVAGVEKGAAAPEQFEQRWDLVIFGHQRSAIRPPAEMRPQCERVLQDSTPVGPAQVITDVDDDPPFLFYAVDTVPIRFHEIRTLPEGELATGEP